MMLSYLKNPKIVLVITLLVVIPFVAYNLLSNPAHNSQAILAEKTTAASPSLVVSTSPTPTASPTATPLQKPAKSTYTIAIIGDSMVDTMGENMDYLRQSLQTRYPETKFNLYNYGIGGQNVQQGLERFDQSFSYQTRNFPPITQINTDIIIIASFAYNPFSPHNRDQHWLNLTQLVNEIRQTKAAIYMLAEIAPLKTGFGDGPGGINWPADIANQQAENIRQQLENAINLSKELSVPLINAYAKSTIDGKFGDRVYVSAHDGIHPSVEGHQLLAQLIVQTVVLK